MKHKSVKLNYNQFRKNDKESPWMMKSFLFLSCFDDVSNIFEERKKSQLCLKCLLFMFFIILILIEVFHLLAFRTYQIYT